LFAFSIVAAACGGPSHPATVEQAKPSQIFPAPAGLIAGGGPQPNGTMWLLAGSTTARNLQDINLLTGKIEKIVPIGADADSIVESSDGFLAVGHSSTSGLVEFRDGSSGALLSSVAVGAPVKAIADGADGTTFYVLNGTATETSVNTVSSTGAAEPPSVGVALNTIAMAVGADNQLYLLNDLGSVTDMPLATATKKPTASSNFFVGDGALQLALSPDRSTLFVLKGTGNAMNVGVFSVETERQLRVLPAPANGVDLLVSIDGSHIYVLVGTPTVGNIQVYQVGG